jgi:hypothetical protein
MYRLPSNIKKKQKQKHKKKRTKSPYTWARPFLFRLGACPLLVGSIIFFPFILFNFIQINNYKGLSRSHDLDPGFYGLAQVGSNFFFSFLD